MNTMLPVRWSGVQADDTASGLLEFSLSITVLLTVITGIAYGALALYANHFVANAARDGARYAMVRGSSWGGASCASPSATACTATSASVQSYVLSTVVGGVKSANLAVVTTWPGTNAAGSGCYSANGANGIGCSVTVAVTYTFSPGLPLVPTTALKFSSSATMPITQ